MSLQKQKARPTIPVRHERFTLINDLLRSIKELYDQTPTEMALRMLKQAESLKAIWWAEEDTSRDQELDELFRNFNEYAHSVRVAALDEGLQ